LGLVLWTLGYPDQARRSVEEGVALAHRIDHPYTSAFAHSVAATVSMLLRDHAACQFHAEAAMVLCKDRFPLWQATSAMHLGWIMAQGGDLSGGLAILEPGLALWEGSGAITAASYFRTYVAEVHLMAGQRSQAARVLNDAWSFLDQGWWVAEQHRLSAELLLDEPGRAVEAENTLRWALELARGMEAQALALRATTSLARLLSKCGRPAEGYALLRQQVQWFTEGFNTPDLADAAALLDELAAATVPDPPPAARGLMAAVPEPVAVAGIATPS
jgi:predicted ATPase